LALSVAAVRSTLSVSVLSVARATDSGVGL